MAASNTPSVPPYWRHETYMLSRRPETLALAKRERAAALQHNRENWAEFVEECKRTLQAPWWDIRDAFEILHMRGLT